MFLSVRNIYRLFRIARTLAHHDALFPLEQLGVAKGLILPLRLLARRNTDGRAGERLSRAMEQLGPSFIKLGQALSTRSDLIGEEVASDLSQLQDHLAPFPASYAKAAIEQELEVELEDLFKEFENQPLAAASIAQEANGCLPSSASSLCPTPSQRDAPPAASTTAATVTALKRSD